MPSRPRFSAVRLFAPVCMLIQLLPALVVAEPLRIGVILPLTGPAGGNGTYALHGIDFAKQETNDAAAVDFAIEDYASNPSKIGVAYQKILATKRPDAMIVFASPVAMALTPLVNNDKIPMIAIAAAPAYSSPNDYTFRITTSALAESEFLVQAAGKAGLAKAAVVHAEDDYGNGYWKPLHAAGAATEESFPPGETDFRAIIAKLRARAPKLVILAVFGQQAGTFLRQSRELNFRPTFVCPQACENPEVFTAAAGTEEGLFVTTPRLPAPGPAVDRFKAAFHQDSNYISWNMFDATNIAVTAGARCLEAEDRATCIRDAIAAGNFSGVAGDIHFDAQGDAVSSHRLARAHGGHLVTVENSELARVLAGS